MIMKPFNLEKALQGEPVVTRDGRDVTSISYIRKSDYPPIVEAFIGKDKFIYVPTGRHFLYGDSPLDLFMKSKTEKYYLNIYKEDIASGIKHTGNLFRSYEVARELACSSSYLKTIEIEIEE